MKTLAITLFFIVVQSNFCLSQSVVDVAESTIKVPAFGEEVFYYGFAEGDQLVFSFEEVNGKELKEVEIVELPGSSKFMDYKVKKIESKVLTMTQTSIIKFRLANSAISGRICRYKIQRIPSSALTQKFNTAVFWKMVNDTTYRPEQEKFLVKSDTLITNVLDEVSAVSSQGALNGNLNTTRAECSLPDGTISWSYYIGVGKEGKEAFDKAKDKFVSSAAKSLFTLSGYGSMAALAVYGINYFEKVQGSDNVKYAIYSDWNALIRYSNDNPLVLCKQGDVVNEAAQMKSPLNGRVFFILENDNLIEPITVIIKVTAVHVKQIWETRMVNRMSIVQNKVAYLANDIK